jgi:TIR domain
MAARIFISYRRSDTQMAAGRLYDALVARYGSGSVFRDKEAIRPGYDWLEEIQNVLAGNVVVLALLGPSWADARDAEGRRRLDDPHDSNRLELEIALQKKIPLIPVLVEGANIPEELPTSLKALTRRHAVRLRDDDWEGDFVRLADALESLGITAPVDERIPRLSQSNSSATAGRLTATALAATTLAGIVLWVSFNQTANLPQSDVKAKVRQSDVKISDKEAQPSSSNSPATKTGAVTTVAPVLPALAGTWRDETYPNVIDQVIQDGQSFSFVRRGALPNGVRFESSGEGRIDGARVSHRYHAQYQGGGYSSGGCSGNLTTDGSRIVLQCSDSLLGQFPAVMVRQ